jgi:microsomal dipeptidase-like Zn-dependent dipeptidase
MARLLDLHAHFGMHLPFPPPPAPPDVSDIVKALELWAANLLFNFNAGKPRVTLPLAHAGDVGGFASVLYDPDDEFFRGTEPRPVAFENVVKHLKEVEQAVAGDPSIVIARNPAAFEAAYRDPTKIAMFHCIEGALAFGGDPGNVRKLADLGVAYVTVAHLFYRGVATCENAFPHMPDAVFRLINPQDENVGLTPLGGDIVRELFACGLLPDITHASALAQEEILTIARDFPGQPVISSHNSVRSVADYGLNLTDEAVQYVADSGGVVGVILSDYWLRPKVKPGPPDITALFKVIDALRAIAGDDAIAIGTDLDGFIHPIDDVRDWSAATFLANRLADRYGAVAADKMLAENALRTLKGGWRGVP